MAANNATGHPAPRQTTPPAAANPANRDQTDTANHGAEDKFQPCRQQHGCQQKSSNADVLPANAYDVDLWTTRREVALNTHVEVTHHCRTRHYLQTGTEDTKSHDRSPSIINSKKSDRLLSPSGPTEEARRGGIGVREVGNADFDGNDGQHTTALDPFQVKSGVGEPKRLHVKSVLMRHVQTRHVTYYSRGFYKRWKCGDAMGASSHRLRHDEHLYGSYTAKAIGSSARSSTCHDCRPQRPGNGSRKRKSKNGTHSSVYGALITYHQFQKWRC